MQKDKQSKVYTGTFISNERKKRPGGRIKCELFDNKIQIYGKNAAIHETQVEWIQIRRYKKEHRGRNSNQRQNKPTNTPQTKLNQINQDNNKQSSKEYAKTQNHDKDDTNQPKPKKYRLKQQDPKEEIAQKELDNDQVDKVKYQSPPEHNTEQQTCQTKSQITQVEQTLKEDEAERKQEKDDQSESSSQQQQEQKKDLQIIVGRIVKETNIVFQKRPFVGILSFSPKKTKSKYQQKIKLTAGPIAEILRDFYADIYPIHSRLPVMELDDQIKANAQILDEYAINVLKYNKNAAKPKSELSRILDDLSNVYILITFSAWDGDNPLARLHKIIGKAMTIEGQCDRFLYEHTLNDFNYQQEIKRQVVQVKPTLLHKQIERMVFTIDPPTSTDLDDALSIESIGTDLFEVGIHIADVSQYLHHIGREEITKRTTSVYLPNKVYHMLSSNLVKACSLDPGVDRLAFTVWIVIDLQGNVKGESRIEKNLIKSRFKLSYEVVQNMMTGNLSYYDFNQKYPSTVDQYEQLLQKLLNLVTIATTHRQKRIAFDVFQNKEIEFKLDEERWPIECFVDKRYTAKKMVQEFMIMGNIEAARHLVKADPRNALVIHHPKPSKLSVTSFNEAFKILQTKFKFENVLEVQNQLLEIDKNIDIKEEVKQLCFFRARRTMQPAIYRLYHEIIQQTKVDKKEDKEPPIVHFALGLQFYTHFTSPMRRMADIIVHQTLTQVLKGESPSALQTDQIQKINIGRKYTKRLKKDLNEVYLCLMIYRTRKPIETEGIISSFGIQSVSIFIPLFDMQKQVLFRKQFDIHSVKRIPRREDELDVKLYHDKYTKKKDVYWVMKRFQKVWLTLGCTKNPPLRLTVSMKVESQKGPRTISWLQD